jgi:hypothetical protein
MRMRWLPALLLMTATTFLCGSAFSAAEVSPAQAAATPAMRPQPDRQMGCEGPDNSGLCFVYLPLISRPAYPLIDLPIGFNSGGWEYPLPDGRIFRKDQAHSPTNGAGYADGLAVSNDFEWEPIEGVGPAANAALYRTARSGVAAYRFNVPNGQYLIELHMAEIRCHGPQMRVFDVAIEGQPVLQALDLHALAQHDYAVVFRFAAEVHDRQLDVTFSATEGEPLVSAIWVSRRTPGSRPPAMPGAIHVIGGYGRAIVRWPQVEEDDVAGYRVYRSASPDGPFQIITPRPTPIARFFDQATVTGQRYCYTAAAVDVYGNEGPRSPVACATVVDVDASNLPMLNLTISAQNLRLLAENPAAEVEVPGTLMVDGVYYSVVAEYRGRSTQFSNKKSWKLVASRYIPSLQTDTLLLNGEGYDPAMIREKVAYDLYDAAGIAPQQASFVRLALNGEFMGVFTRVENPDRSFLLRTGRDAEDDIFKCYSDMDVRPACVNQVVQGRNTGALYTFAAQINRTPDDEFAAAIADILDVRSYLDYQAINSITGDEDSALQYLLHRARSTGRWQVLPWDNNVTFFRAALPPDYGTSSNPGWGFQANVLLTRVLAVPQYRRYYTERLTELSNGLFSLPAMSARLEAVRQEIWFDAQRDVWKVHRENNDAFATSLSHLPHFVAARLDYLRTAVPAYMPQQSRFIGINEVMPRNTQTILDPADGQSDPWFELFNAGLRPVDIGGLYLTDSLGAPTRYRIPDGAVLPALGAMLFWADGQPGQGSNHVNFRLSPEGGHIYLIDRNGTTLVDTAAYSLLAEDTALGRFPDYNGQWLELRQPTPDQPNRLLAPTISDVSLTPRFPQVGDAVTVTAMVSDDGQISLVELVYTADGQTVTLPMFDDGNHGDGQASDGRYGAQIPAFAHGRLVTYYIRTVDDYGRIAFDPPAAAVLTHRYRVGLAQAPIIISEFMADNATTIEDPDEPGEYPDWIELTNLGEEPVNLNGFYLTDNLLRPTKFRISADIIVAPGGAVIFWADDDPQQGPRHTNFKLNKNGETLGIFHRDGATPIDVVEFGMQGEDISMGRCPAHAGAWEHLYLPTPGQPNACGRSYVPLLVRQ